MLITYLGHASFLIETGKHRLVFDPFIRGNELTKGKVDFDALKPDFILVSHGHEDHTADLVDLANASGAQVIGSWEMQNWLHQQGIKNTHAMNFGGSWNFPFGRVKFFQAMHTSSFADNSYAGAAGGFIVETEEHCFYYSGDTGLFQDMKLIPMFHDVSFSFFPIGDNFTMDAEQAAMAAEFVNCDKVIAMHFDTFGFIEVDHAAARKSFDQLGKELIIPEIGKSFEL
ncbi:MAG: metal-dependent hydrolase [Bacteroidetes bacterium]|nr:MAG: metal-dependent hydrolase [Bacteroidota bacterium]